jgi:hypothetical protein
LGTCQSGWGALSASTNARGEHRGRANKRPRFSGAPARVVFLTVCKPNPRRLVGGTRLRPDGLGQHHPGQEGKKRPQAWRAWGLKRIRSPVTTHFDQRAEETRAGRPSWFGRSQGGVWTQDEGGSGELRFNDAAGNEEPRRTGGATGHVEVQESKKFWARCFR